MSFFKRRRKVKKAVDVNASTSTSKTYGKCQNDEVMTHDNKIK